TIELLVDVDTYRTIELLVDAVTYVTICPFSSKDTMVAISPLRSARLSASHASTLRIRIYTYLIMPNPYENLNEETLGIMTLAGTIQKPYV
ncbi:hypothetical protein PIROE2DRAFT_15398, partial [Piromyces sp. E2]